MAALSSLPLAGAAQSAVADNGRVQRVLSPVLVACFSRTGNTSVVAGLLQRATGADVFEIRPAVAYPEEYLATVEQARVERDRGVEPALEQLNAGIARYDTVFLGFPIWGETAPPVIRSFLSKHDLAGKTLVPFITHGGYGLGDSEAVIKRHAPKAVLQRGFSMQADQERQTMDKVTDWLRNAKLAR
jgi:flavodoxin